MTVDLDFFRSQTSQRIRAEGVAYSVLRVLDRRDIRLSEEARQRVHGCDDQELLFRWVGRAVTVSDEAELFEEDPIGALAR